MLHIPSAASYFFLSSIMVFGNKYLLKSWNFNYPIALILVQTFLTIVSLYLVNKRTKIIAITKIFSLTDNLMEQLDSYKYQFLTALFYSLHSITALKALTGLNIPMYATFKRCTPLANLCLSFFLFEKTSKKSDGDRKYHFLINASIISMTVGAIIAGFGDLKFDFNSYMYCGFSVIFQAFYFSFIQKCGEKEKNSMQTFYYSNIFSLPLLGASILFTSELRDLLDYQPARSLTEYEFWTAIIFVLLCGCCLCYSQFWCTTHNSALTTSVIGVLKSFIQTVFGVFLFGAKNEIDVVGYVGIFINLFFGVMYTYLKYAEKEFKTKSKNSDSELLV